jgi:hypothetical protein
MSDFLATRAISATIGSPVSTPREGLRVDFHAEPPNATTPTAYGATATTADEYVAITAVSSTTLTVAITKHDGTPGTTANVAWWAEVA